MTNRLSDLAVVQAGTDVYMGIWMLISAIVQAGTDVHMGIWMLIPAIVQAGTDVHMGIWMPTCSGCQGRLRSGSACVRSCQSGWWPVQKHARPAWSGWSTQRKDKISQHCEMAHKRSWSFCQKCRWQVTAKHTWTLPMWLWMKWHCKLVHGWMVYTELAQKWRQFHVAPAMQQANSAVSIPL